MIREVLYHLGIHSNHLGKKYITYAVELAIKDPSLLSNILGRLCEEIAAHYGTTPRAVYKNMRTAILSFWREGDKNYWYTIAGCRDVVPPTVKAFLEILVEYEKDQCPTAG